MNHETKALLKSATSNVVTILGNGSMSGSAILRQYEFMYSSDQKIVSQPDRVRCDGVIYEHAKEERSNTIGCGDTLKCQEINGQTPHCRIRPTRR
jgi:hypothetical protein